MVVTQNTFVKAFKTPSKPRKALLKSKKKRVDKKAIEAAIEDLLSGPAASDNTPKKARDVVEKLFAQDEAFALNLMNYKLDKAKNDPSKWTRYLFSVPSDRWSDAELQTLANSGDFGWVDDERKANDILSCIAKLPPNKQVAALTGQNSALFKKLDAYADAPSIWKIVAPIRDELLTAVGLDNEVTALDNIVNVPGKDFDPAAAQQAVHDVLSRNDVLGYMCLKSKMDDVRNTDSKKWTQHALALNERWGRYGLPFQDVATRGDFSWIDNEQQAQKVIDIVKGKTGSTQVLILQNTSLLNTLAAKAPQAFTQLKDSVPMLKTVFGVRERVGGIKNIVPGSDDYCEKVADGLFQSILGHDGNHSLTGFSYEADASRTGRTAIDDWLTGLPGAAATAGPCSVLTNIFSKLIKTWPGPGKLEVEYPEIVDPLMTKPLDDIDKPGAGMVTRGFSDKGGNVVEGDKPSGRVFFSGGSTGAAHSWLRVKYNGKSKDYDTLFGTQGNDVKEAVEEKFTRSPDDENVFIGKDTKRKLTRDSNRTNTGAKMGFATYVLTNG